MKKVYNIGYIGNGKYNTNNSYKCYYTWTSILRRCYSEKEQLRSPAYFNCVVDERWHNFQNFAEWYEENYVDGWHLDKDILIKGNKIYGPDTCCFVPEEINKIFTNRKAKRGNLPIGVCIAKKNYQVKLNKFGIAHNLGTYKTIDEAFKIYKEEKEKHIINVANIWKTLLNNNVFNALINYKIEITD